ncbi:hypothetical protein V6N13_084959 [Hibiscus sabdariffa]
MAAGYNRKSVKHSTSSPGPIVRRGGVWCGVVCHCPDPLVAFVFQIHMLLLPLLSDFSPTNCAALTGRSLFYGVTGHRTPFLT